MIKKEGGMSDQKKEESVIKKEGEVWPKKVPKLHHWSVRRFTYEDLVTTFPSYKQIGLNNFPNLTDKKEERLIKKEGEKSDQKKEECPSKKKEKNVIKKEGGMSDQKKEKSVTKKEGGMSEQRSQIARSQISSKFGSAGKLISQIWQVRVN